MGWTVAAQIAGMLAAHCAGTVDCADLAMDWVNRNSVHMIDAEHDAYATDRARVLRMLLDHSEGVGPVPHLSCGPRAQALEDVLTAMGCVSGHFGLKDRDGFGHVALEVYGPDGPFIADADYNVTYRVIATGERASVADLIGLGADGVEPCDAERCGWDRVRHETTDYTAEAYYFSGPQAGVRVHR